ncbi:MAG: ATP-dependent sacrificial sulfur transferase LarE [Bacteroidales bacterium]|nr:ATP-dependent sacrificial sulfur transferase LarE [Bacteroidales bacterium]
MDKKLQEKYDQLLKSMKNLQGIAIAFSGGVDSFFLLHAAQEALGEKVLALTVNSPYIPDWEIKEARKMAKEKAIEHHVIDIPVPEQILKNPGDRCYLCKTFIFTMLKDFAAKQGYKYLADGTNADDAMQHRPGMKALKELNILSPLLESGFTKADIRKASREMDLHTWEKPAFACLLTRIPYNTRINEELLRRIERAETFLIGLGIRAVRVRAHDNLARIETEPR